MSALASDTISPANGTTDLSFNIRGRTLLADNVERLVVYSNAASNLSVSGDYSGTSLAGATLIFATSLEADVLDATGLTSANSIRFFGANGDDIFRSAVSGADDQFNGETGFDTVDYSASTSSVTVNLATGTATGTQIGTAHQRRGRDRRFWRRHAHRRWIEQYPYRRRG